MLRNGIVVFVFLALAVTRPAFGQASTQSDQNHRWPKVDLNVLVVDKSGQPQASLDKSAFHVFENGAERPVELAIGGNAPISLALLIDTSRSTDGNQATVAGVATALIRALPSGSEVMAVLFAEQSYIDLPFTPVEPAPLSFLARLDSRGGTKFYDALVATENYIASNAHNPKRALVILSDGNDNASTLNLEQTLHRIQEEPGAPTIYFIDMPGLHAKSIEKRHSRAVARLVISECGGLVVNPNKNEEAAALSTRITALIHSQYVLTFTAAGAAPDGRFRKLELRTAPAKLEVHAVPGYFPRTQ